MGINIVGRRGGSGLRRRAATMVGVLGLIVGLVMVACESGTEPNGNGNGNGDDGDTAIRATVTLDGSPESGVTVSRFAADGSTALESAQTGSDGRATFTELEAGTFEVEVEVPAGAELADGELSRKSVTVEEGETSTVSFALSTEGGDPGEGDVVEVRLTSSWQFQPSSVTISPGTTVRWINDDGSAGHTVTPREHDEWRSVSMNTMGEVFEHTFDESGEFPYFCQPHESVGMTGTVVVQ